jgi:gas vesicle protein
MKVRGGFVSNSSSSSFIVAVKTEEPVTKALLLELLGIPADSHGAKFFDRIISAIADGEVVEQNYNPADVSSLAESKQRIADLRRQLAQTEKDYAAEADKSTPLAKGLSNTIQGIKSEIQGWEEDVREQQQAMDAELPGGELREPGWTLLSVITDDTECIDTLGCDVLRVSYVG